MRGRGRRGGFNHDRNGFASDPWQPAHTPTSTSLAGQLPSSVPSAPPPSSTAYITAGNVRDDPASKANQHLAATVNEWAAYAHRCRKVALKADAVLTSSGAPSSLAGVDWEAKAVSEEDARKKAAAEVAGLKAGLDVQTKIAADARAGMDFEKTSRDEVVGRLFREADILRAELAQAKSLLANATKPLIGGQPVTAPAADDSVRISPALRKQMSALGCSTQETHVDDGIKVRLPQTKPAAAAPTTRHQLPQAVVAPSDSGTPAVSPTRSARVSVPTPVVADPENFSTQRAPAPAPAPSSTMAAAPVPGENKGKRGARMQPPAGHSNDRPASKTELTVARKDEQSSPTKQESLAVNDQDGAAASKKASSSENTERNDQINQRHSTKPSVQPPAADRPQATIQPTANHTPDGTPLTPAAPKRDAHLKDKLTVYHDQQPHAQPPKPHSLPVRPTFAFAAVAAKLLPPNANASPKPRVNAWSKSPSHMPTEPKAAGESTKPSTPVAAEPKAVAASPKSEKPVIKKSVDDATKTKPEPLRESMPEPPPGNNIDLAEKPKGRKKKPKKKRESRQEQQENGGW